MRRQPTPRQRPALLVLVAMVAITAGAGSRGEGETQAPGPSPIEAELECAVLAAPGEDAEGLYPVWWLESGVPGHWSSGSSIPVFEGNTVNIIVMASHCQAAVMGRGCRAAFDFGGGATYSMDLPFVSPDGIDCPISSLADGVYNVSVALGAPYNARAHAIFAKATPMTRPALDIMFPPRAGYLFGRDIEPFLQLYVQDTAQSLAVANTTAHSAKRASCYVELLVEPEADARARGAVSHAVWEYNPNSRKIFLGRVVQHAGTYVVRARVYDVLKRDTGSHEAISLSLSMAGDSPQACSPGAEACKPQAVAPPEERAWGTWAELSKAIARHCPPLAGVAPVCEGEGEGGARGGGGEACAECSGRGVGVAGVCYCHQDVIGPRCEHDLLRDLAFLPAVHPLDDSRRCRWSLALQRGAEEVTTRLTALQYPPACGEGALSQRRFNKTQGLGVTMRWLGLSQLEAVNSRRTLVVGGRWRAFNFEGCAERGLWCYLSPITNCSVQVWDWGDIERRDFEMPAVLQVPGAGMDQGQLWASALTLAAVMRPSLDFDARLRKMKNIMGWSGRVLGLHVRHGDSCADLARKLCIPSERYLAEAERVAALYGIGAIFLATDDPDVVAKALARGGNHSAGAGGGRGGGGVRYMMAPTERELFSNHMYIEHRLNLGVVDRKGVSDATFLDLFLLRDCDGLVGTFG